jgi:bla regulator protein blaR1
MSIIEQISNPVMNALAWSLLHTVWQILLIGILWKASIFLSRRAPSQLKYNISLVALLAIPLAFIYTFIQQYNIYSNAKRIVLFEFEQSTWINLQEEAAFYLLPKNYPAFLQNFEEYTPFVFWAYFAGIALLSIYFIFSYSRLHRLRRRNLKELPENIAHKVSSIRANTKVSESIKVYLSSLINIPVVVGFFKPMILLPMAMAASLSIQEVESILMHEFYHIRKKDHYINALQSILEIAFFYHPITWIISGQIRREREKRVDEWVVSQTNQPLLYAKALLNLEENRLLQKPAVLSASSSKNTLLTRIKNIMSMKTRKFNSGQKLAAIFVIFAAVLSVAWYTPHYLTSTETTTVQDDTATWVEAPAYELQDNENLQTTDRKEQEPSKIYLEDGTVYKWEDLSESDKQEIRLAMEEVREAIKEVNREVFEKFNTEEFKQEMRKVGEEVRLAMQEVNRELNSEEFKQEMKSAGEEIRMAMEEVKRELNSEEFKQEMQQAREEIRRALQEVQSELNKEEVRAEMKEVGKAMEQVFKELENIDWSGIGEIMGSAMQEMGKSLEMIGPTIQESLKGLNDNNSSDSDSLNNGSNN